MWPDVTPKHSPDNLPRAVERPKLIVVIGVWLLLLPVMVSSPIAVFNETTELHWLKFVVTIAAEVFCVVALYVVSRNYIRTRHRRH